MLVAGAIFQLGRGEDMATNTFQTDAHKSNFEQAGQNLQETITGGNLNCDIKAFVRTFTTSQNWREGVEKFIAWTTALAPTLAKPSWLIFKYLLLGRQGNESRPR